MALPSSQIAAMIQQQQAMFSGQIAYAQQLSYPMQMAAYGGQGGMMMPPPPPMQPAPAPPPMSMFSAMDYNAGGVYGEQLSSRVASVGRTGLGIASAAGGIGLGLAGLDPFGLAIRAGGAAAAAGGGWMGGGLMAGLGVGALTGAAAALPFYAAGKAVDVYSGAFSGGMQDQAALNSSLRSNFRFFGSDAAMGRGFSQSSMGAIGGMMNNLLRNDPMVNAGELTGLIGSGAQGGMFAGVQDVSDFSNKFKRMLETLKTVQKELGGTLTEAMSFVRQSKQLGFFQAADQMAFSASIRTAEATTGLSRDQLMSLSSYGSQLSRSIGGYGRQGAAGALRTASTLGAAVQSGSINEELLSEATGGLTGAEAIQAMTTDIMNRSARFSRRAMGRYSLFALSNGEGTGMDAEMLARFQAGDLTTGDVSGRAHRNVGRMGRARALRQEGVLRGAMLEEGGLSGQIGMMRLMVGDRVLEQGDDLSNLVLQRRFGMSQSQAEVMTNLMRNQSSIAAQEGISRDVSSRNQALQNDIRERGLEAFSRNLGHTVQESLGLNDVREMGRKFVTRLSSIAERAMNDMLGVTENQLTASDLRSVGALRRGRATGADIQNIESALGFGGGGGERDIFARSMFQAGPSAGSILEGRGVRGVREMSAMQQQQAMLRASSARAGRLTAPEDLEAFSKLTEGRSTEEVMREILRAQFVAGGENANWYQYMKGGNANAADAFAAINGMQMGNYTPGTAGRFSRGQGGFGQAMMSSLIAGATGGIGSALATFDAAYTTNSERGIAGLVAGGETVRRLEASGARDINEGGGLLGAIMGRGPARVVAELRATRNDRLLTAMRGVSEESMTAALSNDDVRRAVHQMSGGSAGEVAVGMDRLTRLAAGMEDSDQRKALTALIERAQTERGEDGRLSDELRAQLTQAVGQDERSQQMRDELVRTGANFGQLASAARGVRGGSRRFGDRFEAISRAYESFDVERAQQQTQAEIMRLANMDPNSQEYRDYAAALTSGDGETGELGRGLIQEASGIRQLQRALSGQGRRGGRQRAETALGMLSGNRLSDVGITDERGRAMDASRIERMLRSGTDAERSRIRDQFMSFYSEQGVQGMEGVFDQYTRAIQDGSLSEKERQNLIGGVRGNADIERVQREATAARQAQQDPMGAERNRLLQDIKDALVTIRDREGGGLPKSE